MKPVVVFLTGVMTVFHLVILFPYILYAICIALLLEGCILLQVRKGFRLDKNVLTYLAWYGLLFAFIAFSLMYTVNTINPDYVIKRCGVILVLGYITAALVKEEKDFIVLANGVIVGALLVVVVCFLNEGTRMGVGRIGKNTVGSAVTLSGIALVGFIYAIWRFFCKEKNRKLFAVLAIGMLAIIILTGSRRPLLISIMTTILLIMFNRNIKKSKRFVFMFVVLLLLCNFVYLLFSNAFLYNMIGWRVESMLTTLLGIGGGAEDASMLERTIMKKYGFELFVQRPLLGYGAHGFAYMFYGYYGKLLYSHCGFSELLSCYGMVGFLIFYRIFVLYAKKSIFVLKRGSDVQVLMVIYAALTLISEIYSMAFITPQVIVMMTAGVNMLRTTHQQSGSEMEVRH